MAGVPAAADEEAAFPADAVEVGRVLDAFGIKGWIRIQPFSGDPQALFSSKRWFLKPALPQPGRPLKPAAAPLPGLLRVVQAREQGDDIVAAVHDFNDRNAAETLRGARIYVSRASFPTPALDEFYWVDLIGLAVFNREGQALGTVADLLDTGAHSVLRVQPEQGEERLIPFVAAYVDSVDLPARRMVVDWGLDY